MSSKMYFYRVSPLPRTSDHPPSQFHAIYKYENHDLCISVREQFGIGSELYNRKIKNLWVSESTIPLDHQPVSNSPHSTSLHLIFLQHVHK